MDGSEFVEAVGELFCLATVEMALKKTGAVVSIPGTLEYGRTRTGGL